MLLVSNNRPFLNPWLVACCLAGFAVVVIWTSSAAAMDAKVERGRYLVQLGACNDCHTPGYLFGKPDMSRFLGGSDVGFEVPGMGTFVGPNLTPDKETGLGNWTTEEIVTVLQTGVRPDGRMLAPPMPWRAYANLTKDDVLAIVSYLKSLPPVHRDVPGPFGASEKPTVPRMTILPPDADTAHQ
ncbi:mono/diheme cytochrome c family protein [Nitrobacteraceae bacterium AZCC 1564]